MTDCATHFKLVCKHLILLPNNSVLLQGSPQHLVPAAVQEGGKGETKKKKKESLAGMCINTSVPPSNAGGLSIKIP